jgi:hypothetical protein
MQFQVILLAISSAISLSVIVPGIIPSHIWMKGQRPQGLERRMSVLQAWAG